MKNYMNIGGTKIVLAIWIAASMTFSAVAGDREWATDGKVLTGVAAVAVIDRIVNPPQPVVVYSSPVVVYQQAVPAVPVVVAAPPTVVYVMPPPVVYYQRPYFVDFHRHYRRGRW